MRNAIHRELGTRIVDAAHTADVSYMHDFSMNLTHWVLITFAAEAQVLPGVHQTKCAQDIRVNTSQSFAQFCTGHKKCCYSITRRGHSAARHTRKLSQ
jgi:hypothetical protein